MALNKRFEGQSPRDALGRKKWNEKPKAVSRVVQKGGEIPGWGVGGE